MLFLPAGTPITVKQNNHKALRNIELIVAGDEVGGYDHMLKKFAWGVVKGTKKSIKRGLVALFAGGLLIAQPTLEHPVWTENHHDYVAAQDLKVGDTFLDGKGAILRLDSLVVKPDTTLTVYNFEVENLHNYYVGTQEVLVHNDCATISRLITKGFTNEQIIKLVNATKKAGLNDAQLGTLLGLMDGVTSAKAKAYFDKVIVVANNATTAEGKVLLKKWLAIGPPHGIDVWDNLTKIRNKPEYFEKLMSDLTKVEGKYKALWDEIKNDATKFELWKSLTDDPSKAIQK
ncbi:MAG: polymorphic toxin-type HINT domain-containing protein [Arcicella sp.]|nr:polymorphic toxin-type HINT domain-containing protein [Arcicella sp.]